MKEKIMLGDFIYQLRKEQGFSQAELGYLLGVSNKAVSKWETNEANPDIALLQDLAEILQVSVDELLACQRFDDSQLADEIKCEQKEVEGEDNFAKIFGLTKVGEHEYRSKGQTANGTPYVHVNFSSFSSPARGVLAIGLNAKGIVSIGVISRGVVSIGVLSFGILSFGSFSLGLLVALGAVAISLGVALGAVAVGTLALGAIAVGYMAMGGIVVAYYAHTGLNGLAYGVHIFVH